MSQTKNYSEKNIGSISYSVDIEKSGVKAFPFINSIRETNFLLLQFIPGGLGRSIPLWRGKEISENLSR